VKTLAGSCLSQDETPGQKPATFLDRLKAEHAQLTERHAALTLFLSRHHPEVSDEQLRLMETQVLAMGVYRLVLEMRLTDLASDETFDHKTTRVASEKVIGEPEEIGGHDEDRDGPIPFGD
jgi:hypothetical protein